MNTSLDPFSFVVTTIAGWINRHQQPGYRISDGGESRFCENKIGSHRLRFSDDQRRGLAAKAKKLGRKLLAVVATMRYTRNTVGVASKIDRPKIRWEFVQKTGRRPTAKEVAALVVRMTSCEYQRSSVACRRIFLRVRLRAKACLIRFYSPGFR
jgi:hypothetical protein